MMKAKFVMIVLAGLLMANGPAKVELCHAGSTMEVPANAVEAHLAHGDYLWACVEPTPAPGPAAQPLYTMWLLTRDFRVEHAKGTVTVASSYWHCLIRSDGPPSVERQGALCFPDLFDGQWVADNALCAAPVMSDGSWACDSLTPWRIK